MKKITNFLFLIAIIFIGANLFKLDFNNPLKEESRIALISLLASFCAVLILLIFRISKTIEEKLKN